MWLQWLKYKFQVTRIQFCVKKHKNNDFIRLFLFFFLGKRSRDFHDACKISWTLVSGLFMCSKTCLDHSISFIWSRLASLAWFLLVSHDLRCSDWLIGNITLLVLLFLSACQWLETVLNVYDRSPAQLAEQDRISLPLYSMSQGEENIYLTLDMDMKILFTGWLSLCINYLPHIAEQIILSERNALDCAAFSGESFHRSTLSTIVWSWNAQLFDFASCDVLADLVASFP